MSAVPKRPGQTEGTALDRLSNAVLTGCPEVSWKQMEVCRMAETQKLVTITGRVQMVGFRFFAVRQAQRHAICGYVRNRYDGSVEVLAQGEERDLSRFLSTLKKGPLS